MSQVLTNRDYLLEHSEMNQVVYYMPINVIAGRSESTIFTCKEIKGDSYLIWSVLVVEYNFKD